MANPAPGELSLTTLLQSLTPLLHPQTFVWATMHSMPPLDLDFQMIFREREGFTVIYSRPIADEYSLNYTFRCRMITLNVHSSLEAVGFMAVISNRLKELQIGVNPVSAYYHDHIFVPVGYEDRVMQVLRSIAEEAGREGCAELPAQYQ